MSFLVKYYNLKKEIEKKQPFFLIHEIQSTKKKRGELLEQQGNSFGLTKKVEQLDSNIFKDSKLLTNILKRESVEDLNSPFLNLYHVNSQFYEKWVYILSKQFYDFYMINHLTVFRNALREKERLTKSYNSGRYTLLIKIDNKSTNSFGCLVHNNNLLCQYSIGVLNKQYKEEKYGNYLLSRKLQRYMLLYKWKNKNVVKNIIFECNGIKRFSRASFGHFTQLFIRLFKKLRRMLKRHRNWLLKFARIGSRLRRVPVLTHRQRSHSIWLHSWLKGKRNNFLMISQLRLRKSYKHGIYFTKKKSR